MAKPCFYPNGDPISEDSPCFPELDVSPCCGPNSSCLANGICYDRKLNAMARATCTDSSWKSSNCPQYCLQNEYQGKGAKPFEKRHPRIWPCSNQPLTEAGLICCDKLDVQGEQRERSCCPQFSPMNLFSIGSELGSPVTAITALPAFLLSLSSLSSLPTTIPSPSSATVPSPSTTASPQNSSQSSVKNHTPTTAIAVGTTIGSLFLLTLLATILFFYFRRRRNNKIATPHKSAQHQVNGEAIAGKPPFLPQEIPAGPDPRAEVPAFEMFEFQFEQQRGQGLVRAEVPGQEIPPYEMSASRGSKHLRAELGSP